MDNKQLDSIFKAAMEQAQEEVSPRVWNAVQKSMAAAQARRARIIFLRRMSVGVAALAASLVVAVMLFRGHNSIQPIIFSEEARPALAEAPAVVEPDQKPAATPADAMGSTPVAVPAPAAHAAGKLAEAKPEAKPEVKLEAKPETKPAATVAEPATVPSSEPSKVVTIEDLVRDDRLAESKRGWKPRINVTIGGDIQANGSRTSDFAISMRRSGAPFYPSESTILETGKSSYDIPVTIGLGLKIGIAENLSIGTGVTITELRRKFAGQYYDVHEDGTFDRYSAKIEHSVRYIGVPLNVYYTFQTCGKFGFHVYGGGAVERGLTNKYRIGSSPDYLHYEQKIHGVQVSAGVGLGAEVMFTKTFGLYIDPSVRYYFDCNQPETIRTQHPWLFSLEGGIRIKL